ncbi:MAG: response regulator [Pirellulales bacterium]|nr:response regulator [Pirellulales bacterium]
MRLQTKSLLITGVAVGCLFAALLVVSWIIVGNSFARLERANVCDRTLAVRDALEQRFKSLETSNADWAAWDASYEFVEDGNAAFRDENLSDDAVATLQINVMLYLHRSGRVVTSKCVDIETAEPQPTPLSLVKRDWADDPLIRFDGVRDFHSGVLRLPEGVMLVSAMPIIKSNRGGPIRGALLFGRWLDAKEVERLCELTNVATRFCPVDDPARPAWTREIDASAEPLTWLADSETAEACFTVNDVYGKPILLGITRLPRDITAQGRQSLVYLAFSLLVTGLAFMLLLRFLLRSLVLSRLLRLAHEVASIDDKGLDNARIHVAGNDELAGLAGTVAEMVRGLAQSHRNLRSATEAANQASRSKSAFLANMSHEIRTPMTAILGFTDVLLERVTESELIEAGQTVKRNGEYLLQVINDILDLSKIEAGKIEVERIPWSPQQVVSQAVSLIHQRSEEKGLRLGVEFDGPVPATICTDPVRLQQILVNLLGNAVKFTEAGGIRLLVRCVGAESSKPMMQFEVHDTGIGMNEQQLGMIFQPFTQADSSVTRRFGGTGLGLTISRRFAELLGGDLSARSKPGEGSTFLLTIAAGDVGDWVQVERAAPERSRLDEADAAPPLDPDCRVLLVEDGVDNQRLIRLLLERAGAAVTIADNGQAAVDLVTGAEAPGEPFDVILMDMQMPVLDGYEAAQRLRDAGYTRPIVALTAHAMRDDREKCLRAGCDDYLVKPIHRDRLLSVVAHYAAVSAEPAAEPSLR